METAYNMPENQLVQRADENQQLASKQQTKRRVVQSDNKITKLNLSVKNFRSRREETDYNSDDSEEDWTVEKIRSEIKENAKELNNTAHKIVNLSKTKDVLAGELQKYKESTARVEASVNLSIDHVNDINPALLEFLRNLTLNVQVGHYIFATYEVVNHIKRIVEILDKTEVANDIKIKIQKHQLNIETYDKLFKKITRNSAQVNLMMANLSNSLSYTIEDRQKEREILKEIKCDFDEVKDLIDNNEFELKIISQKIQRLINSRYLLWVAAFFVITIVFCLLLAYGFPTAVANNIPESWYPSLIIIYVVIVILMGYKVHNLYLENCDIMETFDTVRNQFAINKEKFQTYCTHNEKLIG